MKIKEDIISHSNFSNIGEWCDQVKSEMKKNEVDGYKLYGDTDEVYHRARRRKLMRSIVETQLIRS